MPQVLETGKTETRCWRHQSLMASLFIIQANNRYLDLRSGHLQQSAIYPVR